MHPLGGNIRRALQCFLHATFKNISFYSVSRLGRSKAFVVAKCENCGFYKSGASYARRAGLHNQIFEGDGPVST